MYSHVAAEVLRRFRKAGHTEIVTLVDCDDFLHPLLEPACRATGVDYERASMEFDLSKNSHITAEEGARLAAAFGDPEMFRNMQFYPGAERLLEIQRAGAKLTVKSLSYSEEIGELKRVQLPKGIPGLKPEQIEINVVTHEKSLKKAIPAGTTLALDDNPYIIAESEALVNLLLGKAPYATSPSARRMMRDRFVVTLPDLNSIIDYACEICNTIRAAM